MARMLLLLPLLLGASLLSHVAAAACGLECTRQAVENLLDEGRHREAIDELRDAITDNPQERSYPLLLARAYLLEGNLFWAERTLNDAVARWPDDTELRSWLAAVHLRQGDPQLVSLDFERELGPAGPLRARWQLLEAFRASLEGDEDTAAAALAEVSRRQRLFPEDRQLWDSLNRQVDRWWNEALTGSLELSAGRTSNALAGAPTDPGRSGEASNLGGLELHSRLTPPHRGPSALAVDLGLLGSYLGEQAFRELSNLQGSLRLGALLQRREHRLLLGYRAEVLLLDQSPSRYATAHRLELELEKASGWVAFAGAGKRRYRDERRTRWEADIGLGGPLHLVHGASTVAGATLRLAAARSPAYDQRGITLAVASRLPLGHGFAARLALSGSWDDYPSSGGREGLLVYGTQDRRRDRLGRLGLQLWAPSWHGLRPGLEYQCSRRRSTAADLPGFDFSYREERLLLLVRWSFSADPWGPRAAREPGHVPFAWGLGQGSDEHEQILQLLRQDEELRRGSSCGVR